MCLCVMNVTYYLEDKLRLSRIKKRKSHKNEVTNIYIHDFFFFKKCENYLFIYLFIFFLKGYSINMH